MNEDHKVVNVEEVQKKPGRWRILKTDQIEKPKKISIYSR